MQKLINGKNISLNGNNESNETTYTISYVANLTGATGSIDVQVKNEDLNGIRDNMRNGLQQTAFDIEPKLKQIFEL